MIRIEKSTSTLIPKDEQNLFNCGYLFLEKLYYELGLDQICKAISEKYKFEYDLNNILSRLIYGRIIFPASKLATNNLSKKFIEQPNFELHDIPLAFNITSGNTNEQTTLTPLEEKILEDFKLSRFIVCTDAGLSSTANRKFNNKQERAFITTQSIKKFKKDLMKWALNKGGWKLSCSKRTYNIDQIEENEELYRDKIFYKECWINESGLEQKLIVTYSIKYRNYQRQIRNSQIDRAQQAIDNNSIK